ncbi:putative reverse transcriptase domain-containing protein [Tanacetum coccineum]
MGESAKRHEENSNLIKEIRASTDAAIRNQGASIKTLEIQIEQMSKLDTPYWIILIRRIHGTKQYTDVQNKTNDDSLADLGASVSVLPLSTYLNLGLGELAYTKLIVELADMTVKYPKGIAKNVLVGIGKFTFPVDFIILDMPEDIKVPLILRRSFLSTAHAKIDVFKRKITLKVGEEKIIFKVSLDPLYEDYIELNDLNVPLELRRDQVDDLMPTIKEGEVVGKFRARNDARMISKKFGYPSDYDHDKKILILCYQL